MCRSIKTLRPVGRTDADHAAPVPEVTETDIQAAALQYVRKVSGFRTPAPHNAAVFDEAVRAVAAATTALLAGLVVRGGPARARP